MSFSFGGTTAAAPSSAFSFGGAAPAAAPASSGGGFNFGAGTTTPAPSTGGGGGFSFGSSTGQPSAAPASSGFGFGAPTGSGGTSSFNFGATAGTTSTAARSLFGSTPGSAGTAPAATGGSSFFGAAPATSGSVFGSTGTTTSTGGSSFFGSAPAGGGSPFGSSSALTTAAPATGSSFGLFGGAAGTPQQTGLGITLETPFDTLPVDVKKNIAEFHHFLKEEDQSDAFLKTVSPRKLEELDENIQKLEQDVLVRRNIQDRQATSVHHLRKDVKKLIHQVDNASLSMRTLDGNSASNMYHIMRHVETPSPYYWDLLDHFESKMENIKTQIEDIESEFKPLYERRAQGGNGSLSSQSVANMSPALLHQIMLSQNAALMQVAARVAEVHERADEMRQQFLVKMRQDLERRGEYNPAAFKNPFEQRMKNAHEDKRQTIDKIRFRTNVAPTIVTTTPAAVATAPQQPSGFGFGAAAPAAAATTTTIPSLFGGASASAAAPATGSSLFGTTAPSTAGSGFGFGATSAAPKQVSFNLSSAPPTAPTLSAFSVPSVSTTAPSAFGGVSSSFLPGDAEKRAAGSKRVGGRQKKRA